MITPEEEKRYEELCGYAFDFARNNEYNELEKMINEAITEEMGAISKEMVDVVSQEIVNQASNAINNISVGGAAPKVKSSKMDFGKMLGRALGRAAAKVIQEITKTKRR